MSIKRHFVPDAPPPPRGVKYHHATEAGGWLYVTGQLPTNAAAPGDAFPDGIEAQVEQTFKNLVGIVEAAGYALRDSVFVRLYLADFDRDFDGLNRVYHRYFPNDDAVPSRTTIGVARLGRGALVEIDLVLYKTP
jgi:2-iminobutanoate/2-iminopropanoate deaminase